MQTARGSLVLVFVLAGSASAQRDDEFADLARRGMAEVRAQRYAQAVEWLERAHALRADDRAVAEALAVALSHVGSQEHEAGNLRDALGHFERADALWPQQAALLTSVGQLRLELGDRRGACRAFEAVVELDPANARALAALGRISVLEDDVVAAAEWFARACRAAPGNRDYEVLAEKYSRHATVEGEFRSLRHGIFELQYPAERAAGVQAALPTIRTWLDGALRDLRLDFGRIPAGPIRVVLYGDGQFRQVSTAKHWAKAYYDGKVRLDLGPWERDRDGIRQDLRHELAHACLHTFYPGLPAWIHEGYAQFVERRPRAIAIARSLCRGGLLDRSLWTQAFVSSEDVGVVERGYAQSLLAIARLREMRTTREFTRFLKRVSAGKSSADAVREVYRVELDELFEVAAAPR